MKKSIKPMLSKQQVAEMLCLSISTIDRLARAGKLKAVAIGVRRIAIETESVELFLAAFAQAKAKKIGGAA